jgi:hypothetical protein
MPDDKTATIIYFGFVKFQVFTAAIMMMMMMMMMMMSTMILGFGVA